jgi:hypothetical protein
MTPLARALAWFLEPPADDAAAGAPEAAPDRPAASTHGTPPQPRPTQTAWLRPVGAGPVAAPAALDDFAPAARGMAARREVRCAAVLGRPGHAEPVAAALALALAAGAQVRAASVVVIGPAERADAGVEGGGDGQRGSGGTRAARRLAMRLDAHGLVARPRGRLVWVEAPSEGRQAAVRRAALVGAPAVLAVTAPRAPDIEELLAEQDLALLVMSDPGGPLARLAALAPGGVPIAVTRPLPRGPARSLALAGISAPHSIRRLAAGGEATTRPEAA